MTKHLLKTLIVMFINFLLLSTPILYAQSEEQKMMQQSAGQTAARADRFTRQCDRRTAKAERRMARYEKKLQRKASKSPNPPQVPDRETVVKKSGDISNEPMMDSLQTVYKFAEANDLLPAKQSINIPSANNPSGPSMPGMPQSQATNDASASIAKAKDRINLTQQTKAQMQARKEQLHEAYGDKKQYARLLEKVDKENYYYVAQINTYRKALKKPSGIEETVMALAKKDPRWSDFLATLPSKKQDPEKMQPKQLAKQMMQSQASAVDPDAMKLITDAKEKSSGILDNMMGSEAGSAVDNASQMPSFKPDPYKTAGLWDHFDVGFDMAFERQSYKLPSSGTVGLQLLYHITDHLGMGILGNYRYGLGENIKNIHFSSMGAGYGGFVNYMIIWGFGLQVGWERNYLFAITANDGQEVPAGWTSALLLGITKEYRIGKKMKGNVSVFYDFLHNRHEPQTNAWLWRMGWRF